MLTVMPLLWSFLPGYTNTAYEEKWSAIWLTWDDISGGSVVVNWRWTRQGPAYIICWNSTHTMRIDLQADFINNVRISGLSPQVTYYYVIGHYEGNKMVNWSSVHNFRIPSISSSVTAIVLSDTHAPGNKVFHKILERIRNIDADFIIHCGDIVDRSFLRCWASFFKSYSSILSRIPIMPTVGNHEIEYGDPTLFYKFFALPNNEKWYYYRVGYAICVSLYVSEMFTFSFPDEEYKMLQEAAKIARDNGLWLIVYFHIPPIDVMPMIHFPEIANRLREVFSTIKPDLIFAGHYHVYGRTEFLGSKIVLMGTAGGLPNQLIWEGTFEKYSYRPGFGLLRVEADSLYFRYISANGELIDAFELKRI